MSKGKLFTALLILGLVGCAPTAKKAEFHANYYPECYDPITKLCKEEDHAQEIKTATKTALVPGFASFLITLALTRDIKTAAQVGLPTFFLSASAGYFTEHLKKVKDNERMAEYQKLLGQNSKGWDQTRITLEQSYQCYKKQINLLTQQMKAKKIDKVEFLARMDEIEHGITEIKTYSSSAHAKIDARLADGETFLKKQQKNPLAQLQDNKNQTSQLRTQMRNDMNKAHDKSAELLRSLETSKQLANTKDFSSKNA